MKKYIASIFVASALISLAGCNKAENPQADEQELVNTTLTVSVEIADNADTKTTLADNYKVYWAEGDKFYGFHKYGAGNSQTEILEFTIKNGAGTKSATFEYEGAHQMILAGDQLYGIYGCTLNEEKTLPVWPKEQFATTSGTPLTGTTVRNIKSVPMFALTQAVSNGNFGSLSFKNGGGLVQINVHNNTETDISPDMLFINSKDTYLCGEFNLPSFDSNGIPSIEFTSRANKTLSWKYDDSGKTVEKTTTVPLNVAIPAGTYSGLKFTYTGNFGTIPYGFIRDMKDGASITVHRSQIDQITMDLFVNKPIDDDSPVGSIGTFTDLQDPHHRGGRTGMIVGFDFSEGTGKPKSALVICTANLVLSGNTEIDGQEAPWNKGSLVKYNDTNKYTSAHWRLMTVDEANAVINTDEHGTGKAQWGTLNGVQGIYWYFDPARYIQYNAEVVPNSIFLPVTHNNASQNARPEGRYWLNGNYYFEFWQDPSDPKKGIVNVIYDKNLADSDHLGAIRLVHDITINAATL